MMTIINKKPVRSCDTEAVLEAWRIDDANDNV